MELVDKKTILCVDDQRMNLRLLEEMLVRRGFQVICAEDGRQALEALADSPVDLVLLDVMLPDIIGFDVCRMIKGDEKTRHIPVVMITSLTSREDRIKGIEAGADDYLLKPFDQAEVMARIGMLLKLKAYNDRFERELQQAKRIQMSLLPGGVPDIQKAAVAYKYVPMSKIGGDFLDIVYNAQSEEIGLFVCDVSGHGIPAALMASMVKISLSSWESTMRSPADSLTHVKSMLANKMGENFITACMCHVDLKSGTLTAANAGHPPLLLARRRGDVERIKPGGKLITDFVTLDCENATARLEEGDKLILYTDCVIEARSHVHLLGIDRFIDLVRLIKESSPQEMCEIVYNSVLDYSPDGKLDDDFTILVMEYLPSHRR